MDSPPPFDDAEQAARLELFLRWLLPLVAVFFVLELVLSLAFDDPQMRAASLIVAVFAAIALVAWWLVRQGRVGPATALLAIGLLAAGVGTAIVQPAVLAGLTLIPLLAFAVASLFLHGRALALTALGCWVGATMVVVLGRMGPAASPLPPVLLDGFVVGLVAAAAGLVLMLSVRSSERLNRALAETRRAIDELRVAEADRREVERLLLERQRHESLGVLAGGVAHDVNNTLTAILGHAELARADAAPASDQARSLDAIIDAAEHGATLSGKMLAYSGRGAFSLQTVDLPALVDATRTRLTERLPAGVPLVVDVAPLLPAIQADPRQLVEVLRNVVTNAGEAIGPHPGPDDRVTIRLAPVQLEAAESAAGAAASRLEPGAYVAIDVTDTGPGLDEATRAQAFDPFFSTRFPGRGLGLAVVLGIVRGHGGAVTIEPRQSRGTHLRILLPVEPPAGV